MTCRFSFRRRTKSQVVADFLNRMSRASCLPSKNFNFLIAVREDEILILLQHQNPRGLKPRSSARWAKVMTAR